MECGEIRKHLKHMASLPTSHVPIRKPTLFANWVSRGEEGRWYKEKMKIYEEQKNIANTRRAIANDPKWSVLRKKGITPEETAWVKNELKQLKIGDRVEVMLSTLLYLDDETVDNILDIWQDCSEDAPLLDPVDYAGDLLPKIKKILDEDYDNIYTEKQKGRLIYAMLSKIHGTYFPPVPASTSHDSEVQKYLLFFISTVFGYVKDHADSRIGLMTVEFLNRHFEDSTFYRKMYYARDEINYIVVKNLRHLPIEEQKRADRYIFDLIGVHVVI